MVIRPSQPGDAPHIARLIYEAALTYREFAGRDWEPPLDFYDERATREGLRRTGVWALSAEHRSHLIAHIAFNQARTREEPRAPIDGMAHLWRLFVRPDHWGTGLAGALLQRAHTEMRARGYVRARLFTPAGSGRARGFYEREGWHAAGEAEYYEDIRLELVEYRLDLSA